MFTNLPFDIRGLTINLSPYIRVLGFSLTLSLLTGVAFGLLPAFQATHWILFETGEPGYRLAIPWLGYGARCSQRKYVTGVFLDGQWHSDHATTPLDSITGFTGDHDAELIKIQGRLLGHSMQGDDLVLAMETGGAAFTAL